MRAIAIFVIVSLSCALYAQGEKGGALEVAGKTFTVPPGWESAKPSSAMRKAQFKVGDAEVVVFFFGEGQGGGVEANVARWLGQFKETKDELGAKSETEEVGGGKVTTVSAKGTYLKGPPFGAKVETAGYALRGAILEFDGGPLFVKMTGPEKAVAAAAEGFDKMVRSGLKK